MSYVAAAMLVAAFAGACVLMTWLIQRLVALDRRRRHHDVGSVIFLQLGVVFAVLLAFVFSEAWEEYDTAAQSESLEAGALHGGAMIAATLPPAQARLLLGSELDYLYSVVRREWPVMAAERREDPATTRLVEALVMRAADVRLADPDDQAKKSEVLSLLAAAHAQREVRIFQADSGIPAILWFFLISFTLILTTFVSFSGVESRRTAIMFAACFAGCISGILTTARLLDYPFEGALALRPNEFVAVAAKIDALLADVGGR